ncbi:MAG TPA: DoxX family protein [Bacteroidales bacterium]
MNLKTKNILVWILAGILAFIFAFVGIEKLLGTQDQLKNFEEWHLPLWYRFPIAVIEIIIAGGLLWPFFRRITIYGIFVWAIAAAALHIHAGQLLLATLPLLLGVIAVIILLLIGKVKQT